MSNLYILHESFVNGLASNLLNVTFVLSIVFGILVIISRNPIVSVLYLIGLFLVIAYYLISLGMSFVGLSYLLVYVGAVSILFLFILMLINVRVSELVTDNNNSIPLSIIITAIFNIILLNLSDAGRLNASSFSEGEVTGSLFTIFNSSVGSSQAENNTNVFYVTSGSWDASLSQVSHITAIGNVIYTSYPILLILISVILLLAMVGAIVITIKPSNPQ